MADGSQLTEKLAQARDLLRAYFEVPGCNWEQRFHQEEQECRSCGDSHVCQWLFEQDPAPDLQAMPPQRLREALQFAVGYLEGRMIEAGHDPMHCACATCKWLRGGHSLLHKA